MEIELRIFLNLRSEICNSCVVVYAIERGLSNQIRHFGDWGLSRHVRGISERLEITRWNLGSDRVGQTLNSCYYGMWGLKNWARMPGALAR